MNNLLDEIIDDEKSAITQKLHFKEPQFKKISEWNDKIEKTVKVIEKQCRLYKELHHEVSENSKNRHNGFMMSAIILTPLSNACL